MQKLTDTKTSAAEQGMSSRLHQVGYNIQHPTSYVAKPRAPEIESLARQAVKPWKSPADPRSTSSARSIGK